MYWDVDACKHIKIKHLDVVFGTVTYGLISVNINVESFPFSLERMSGDCRNYKRWDLHNGHLSFFSLFSIYFSFNFLFYSFTLFSFLIFFFSLFFMFFVQLLLFILVSSFTFFVFVFPFMPHCLSLLLHIFHSFRLLMSFRPLPSFPSSLHSIPSRSSYFQSPLPHNFPSASLCFLLLCSFLACLSTY